MSSNGDQFQGSRGDKTRRDKGAERGARPRGVQPEPEHRLACLRCVAGLTRASVPARRRHARWAQNVQAPRRNRRSPPTQIVPNPTPPCQTRARGKIRLSAPASETRASHALHWRTAEQTRSHGSTVVPPPARTHTHTHGHTTEDGTHHLSPVRLGGT